MMFFIDFMNGETVTVIRLSAFAHLSQMQLQDNTMYDMSATERLMYEYIHCVSTSSVSSKITQKSNSGSLLGPFSSLSSKIIQKVLSGGLLGPFSSLSSKKK